MDAADEEDEDEGGAMVAAAAAGRLVRVCARAVMLESGVESVGYAGVDGYYCWLGRCDAAAAVVACGCVVID